MVKSSKLLWAVLALFTTVFSLSGCSVNGEKTANYSLLYAVMLFCAVAVPIGYFVTVKNKNKWFIFLFICIIMVNTGYLLLAYSKTLSFALWANRISYLGSVFLPFSMLMAILNILSVKYSKFLPYSLLGLGSIVFIIAASPGYLDIYYKTAEIAKINGITVLIKEYGSLHIIYLFYLIFYFSGMIYAIIKAKKRKKLTSAVYSGFLLTAVFINIAVWFLEQLVKTNFELLSVSYVISEAFIWGLFLIMQENEKKLTNLKSQVHQNLCPTEDGIEFYIKGIKTLTKTEKTVFDYYIEGKTTKEIRELLGITENTLKYHNKNIYGKLGVTSRKELVAISKYIKQAKVN